MQKIGIIGAGFMGSMHASCYKALESEGAVIAAVAATTPERAQKLAEGTNAVCYSEGMDLISDPNIDVVDICAPTYLHTKYAVAAMEQGKSVFIEKPVCLTPEETDILLDAQKRTGAAVMVGQCVRLWGEYAWLKEVTDSKLYGKLLSGVFKRVSPLPTWASNGWLLKAETCGTACLDMHVHDVDYVRYLLGEPDSFQSMGQRDSEGILQQIFTSYDFNGSTVTTEACWDYPTTFPFSMSYRIKFEKAAVLFDSSTTPLTVYPYEGESFMPEIKEEFAGSNEAGGNLSSLGAYYSELKYFITHLENGLPIEMNTLSDAVASARLTFAEIARCGGAKL